MASFQDDYCTVWLSSHVRLQSRYRAVFLTLGLPSSETVSGKWEDRRLSSVTPNGLMMLFRGPKGSIGRSYVISCSRQRILVPKLRRSDSANFYITIKIDKDLRLATAHILDLLQSNLIRRSSTTEIVSAASIPRSRNSNIRPHQSIYDGTPLVPPYFLDPLSCVRLV